MEGGGPVGEPGDPRGRIGRHRRGLGHAQVVRKRDAGVGEYAVVVVEAVDRVILDAAVRGRVPDQRGDVAGYRLCRGENTCSVEGVSLSGNRDLAAGCVTDRLDDLRPALSDRSVDQLLRRRDRVKERIPVRRISRYRRPNVVAVAEDMQRAAVVELLVDPD